MAATSQDNTVTNADDVHIWDELNEIELELDNLNDISDSEEEVFVYDEAGDPVDLDPNSRKVVSKVPLIKRRGKRGKPTNSLYFNFLMLALKFYLYLPLLIESVYEKDGTKRAKARYNYQTGFRRKMHQYRTVTKDDVTICFEESTKTKNNGKVLKYSTSQDLIKPVSKIDKSTQTMHLLSWAHS